MDTTSSYPHTQPAEKLDLIRRTLWYFCSILIFRFLDEKTKTKQKLHVPMNYSETAETVHLNKFHINLLPPFNLNKKNRVQKRPLPLDRNFLLPIFHNSLNVRIQKVQPLMKCCPPFGRVIFVRLV